MYITAMYRLSNTIPPTDTPGIYYYLLCSYDGRMTSGRYERLIASKGNGAIRHLIPMKKEIRCI